MLESLITSKTRVKLLLKLFLNTETSSHLRGMSEELGESSNSIRVELNRFVQSGLLHSRYCKNKRIYRANTNHPLYEDIHSILRKMVGIDTLVERVTCKIGNLEAAYLTGSFASGLDSNVIELALIGENLDEVYIHSLVEKTQNLMERDIYFLVLTAGQMERFFKDKPILLIWKKDEIDPLHRNSALHS